MSAAVFRVRHRIYAELPRLSRPEPGNKSCAIISPPPVRTEIAARVSTRREAVAQQTWTGCDGLSTRLLSSVEVRLKFCNGPHTQRMNGIRFVERRWATIVRCRIYDLRISFRPLDRPNRIRHFLRELQ
jgi:hypothetical protein